MRATKKIAMIVFLIVLAVLVFLTCNKIEFGNEDIAAQKNALIFKTYIPRTTKASFTDTALKSISDGFGVFAYYTNNVEYSVINAAAADGGLSPNFMYNQKVSYNRNLGSWDYSPVKFWPGEGTSDVSKGSDYLSFFAYAPYVDVSNETGAPTKSAGNQGIISLSSNLDKGNPRISFRTPDKPKDNVDLLWGVATSGNANAAGRATKGSDVTVSSHGMPNVNLTQSSAEGDVTFTFMHATSRIGVNVQGAFDEDVPGTNNVAEGTKVTIDNVKITGPFPRSGVLDLYNTKAGVANWLTDYSTYDSNGTTTLTIDSKHDLAPSLQDSGDGIQTSEGVTNTNVNLMTGVAPSATDTDTYFNIVPTESTEPVTVQVDYYVTTADSQLALGYSRIQHHITKSIELNLSSGVANTINIVIGLYSVKMAATVSEWNNVE